MNLHFVESLFRSFKLIVLRQAIALLENPRKSHYRLHHSEVHCVTGCGENVLI